MCHSKKSLSKALCNKYIIDIKFGRVKSGSRTVVGGIPQGSVMGPIYLLMTPRQTITIAIIILPAGDKKAWNFHFCSIA